MWIHLLGAFVGAIVGLLFVWLQIWGLKRYARNKEPHVAERAYDAIGQVMTSNLIGDCAGGSERARSQVGQQTSWKIAVK